MLTEADRAFLLAMRAWADPRVQSAADGEENARSHALILRFRDWLDPVWVQRLCEAWDRESRDADASEPARALDRLRKMHQASARVDLGRVHPSWWVRALLEESPAVQRVVTTSLPESLRHPVQAGLLLDSQDLLSERAVAPEVLGWVLGLWTERLVGGEPERPDDPPAIRTLSCLSPRAGYGLCRLAGFCKMLLAGQKPGDAASDHRDTHGGSGCTNAWRPPAPSFKPPCAATSRPACLRRWLTGIIRPGLDS